MWQNYNVSFWWSVNNRAITNKKDCTFASPLIRALDERTRASTIFLRSRCNLLWKSLNIVEPPDKTIFYAIVNRHKPSVISKSNKKKHSDHAYLVKSPPRVDWGWLDALVDNNLQRSDEPIDVNLWVEEDLNIFCSTMRGLNYNGH
jgi:hypothetical protein